MKRLTCRSTRRPSSLAFGSVGSPRVNAAVMRSGNPSKNFRRQGGGPSKIGLSLRADRGLWLKAERRHMGTCKCGAKMGFMRGGLCDSCRQREGDWERALTRIQQLSPVWMLNPPFMLDDPEGPSYVVGPHLRSLGPTPDGDHAEVVLHAAGVAIGEFGNCRSQ